MFRSYNLLRSISRFPKFHYTNQLSLTPLLTSNNFLVLQTPLIENPFLTIDTYEIDSLKLEMERDKTINQLFEKIVLKEQKLKNLEFFSYDHARISSQTKLSDLLSLPYFIIRINDMDEYNIISEKNFSFYNKKYKLSSTQKKYVDACKDLSISATDAKILGEFCAEFVKELTADITDSGYTEAELRAVIKDLLVKRASSAKIECDIIEEQLLLLKEHRRNLYELKNEIEKMSEKFGKRMVKVFFGIVFTQFLAIQYGTYVLFSWDIMEPITCAMTLGDGCLAYFFWILSKRSYSMETIYQYFEEKKKRKVSKKLSYEENELRKVEDAIALLKGRLNELK